MGEYCKGKAIRSVRLRYVNWRSKERQQGHKILCYVIYFVSSYVIISNIIELDNLRCCGSVLCCVVVAILPANSLVVLEDDVDVKLVLQQWWCLILEILIPYLFAEVSVVVWNIYVVTLMFSEPWFFCLTEIYWLASIHVTMRHNWNSIYYLNTIVLKEATTFAEMIYKFPR